MMNGKWAIAKIGESDAENREHEVATDDDDHEPPRNDTAHREPDERGKDEESIRSGIEQLPQTRHLVEFAGDHTVKKVGDAGDHQHEKGQPVLAVHDQNEKHRNEKQPDETQDVGDRENARSHLVAPLGFHEAKSIRARPSVRIRCMAPLLIVAPVFVVACVFAWSASVITADNSWVDRLWSLLPPVYLWIFAGAAGMQDARLNVMAVLVTMWGARLTFNFARKGGYSGGEDYRWPVLRSRMKAWQFGLFNLFFIVVYQNILLVLITLPALTAFDHRGSPSVCSMLPSAASSSSALWERLLPTSSNGTSTPGKRRR